jgi:hypothetical protein
MLACRIYAFTLKSVARLSQRLASGRIKLLIQLPSLTCRRAGRDADVLTARCNGADCRLSATSSTLSSINVYRA